MLAITLEGTPFERGVQHGRRFAAEIREEIGIFCPEHWLDAPEVKELERRLMSTLARLYPELLVEMNGISQGAGIPFEQIAMLNLVLATNDLESDAITATFKIACSAIGIRRSEVGPVVAKNCDERLSAAPFYVFQTVYPEEGLAYMGISNVGTLWLEGGINEAGLALMQTAGPVAPDQDGYGIACNIAPRPLLNRCRTTAEAAAMIDEMPVAGWGMGLVLGDAGGDVAVVEKSGSLCAISRTGGQAAYCTNHFVAPGMQAARPIPHPGLMENSTARYDTLGKLVRAAEPGSLGAVEEILGYHGELGFVCQHGDANMYSNYSCLAICQEKKALVGTGFPCQRQYLEFRLERS